MGYPYGGMFPAGIPMEVFQTAYRLYPQRMYSYEGITPPCVSRNTVLRFETRVFKNTKLAFHETQRFKATKVTNWPATDHEIFSEAHLDLEPAKAIQNESPKLVAARRPEDCDHPAVGQTQGKNNHVLPGAISAPKCAGWLRPLWGRFLEPLATHQQTAPTAHSTFAVGMWPPRAMLGTVGHARLSGSPITPRSLHPDHTSRSHPRPHPIT